MVKSETNEEIEIKQEDIEKTQKLDPVEAINMQKTQILDTTKLENNSETQIIDSKEVKNENEKIKANTSEINLIEKEKDEETPQASFESITEKLLEQKLKADMQNTQIIDTNKVREAMKEEELPKDFEEMYKKTFGVEPFAIRKV